jgi:cytoplasmic tRNA 2-thiolation protein 1
VLRGDIPRLARCVAIVSESSASIPRIKPFKYTYEKEIVLYAYHKKLKYFSTECTYSSQAFRGFAREYIKEMEKLDSSCLLNIINSAEQLRFAHKDAEPKTLKSCEMCGYQSSQRICRGCGLRQELYQLKEKKMASGESVREPDVEKEEATEEEKG